MALKLDILANTRNFVTEMKKAGASADDITDALDELKRQGDKAGDELESSFRDVAKAAEKADKQVEKIGGGAQKGFGQAAGASTEFKDEALSNLSEVTSSFDGSMESIGDLVQGTLGGVAASLPGIGLAAGAVAVGVGGITARFEELGTRSEEIKQGIIDDFLELGDALDKEAVDARVRDILGVENTRKQAELLAEILDVSVGQAALALAGDFESAGVTAQEVVKGINEASGNVNYDLWVDLKNTVDATTSAMDAGKDAADAQAEAIRRTADSNKKELAATKASADAVKSSLDSMGSSRTITIDADNTDALNKIEEVRRAASKSVTVAVKGALSWTGQYLGP